jgi:hypothetical protein
VVAELKPHPANVPGDFYVVDGCCTMCEIPFSEAPDLFGRFQEPEGCQHCYVQQQPERPAEVDAMIRAIQCAELLCIRYRGTDKVILDRLETAGESGICDALPPAPTPL